MLSDDAEKAAKANGSAGLLTVEEVNALRARWVHKVKDAATNGDLLAHPALGLLASGWLHWGSSDEVREWWMHASAQNHVLVALVDAMKSYTTSQPFGDYAVKKQIRVRPAVVERFGDSRVIADRLREIIKAGGVPEEKLAAVRQFLLECDMIAAGKNPDAPFAFDQT